MNTTTEVKERPILFSTPMVIATLKDRKTITRRVKGLEIINQNPDDWQFNWFSYGDGWCFNQKSTLTDERIESGTFNQVVIKCPYGLKSDILWVRENLKQDNEYGISYVADGASWNHPDDYCYRDECYNGIIPSIHMPKVACRLKLEIVSIGVERLQDITEEDAKREGAPMYVPGHGVITKSDLNADPGYANFLNYRIGFEHLWYEINGAESWEANPWVWRIEFKKINAGLAIDSTKN